MAAAAAIVELPAKLPPGAQEKLRSTRISGQLIGLTKDDAPRAGGGHSRPKQPHG